MYLLAYLFVFTFIFGGKLHTVPITYFHNSGSGGSSSSSWLGINGGRVISMSSNKRHERTGREMYATYRHGHFISGEECEVICLEVPEQKTAH